MQLFDMQLTGFVCNYAERVQRKTPFQKLPLRVQAAKWRSMQSKDCYFEEKSFSPAKRVCEFARCQL